ncbi:MAG: hypothetical protein UT53_C0007G0030 [Candidatus Yanofskybacteria bacterium GW2011_GWD2_39_48]|uniref:Uncharacterized protein n=1 Tax=Candidatus Yanofskybacteria bacterium GW2011_GWD2_39_48 TaxID=1619031 RepID=A0A0G0SDS3_9BACT|nr:MAG: hypothetical protein UT53_C0007G0030 [Candidatus Yanofskybacteria bacterium GW2011_GWD2_39_48]
MERLKFTNIAVFIIFFGVALFEALRGHNWLEALIFLILGVISLWVDVSEK